MRLAFVLFFLCGICFAETFFVQRVIRMGGITSDEASAITSLITSTVVDHGHQITAQVSQANYILESRLVKLGKSYTLAIEKKKNEKVFFSSKMKASQLEELDELVVRLVKAVISETDPFEEAEVGRPQSDEGNPYSSRKPSTGASYMGFGPATLKQLNNPNVGIYANAAFVWDVSQAIVRLGGHFAFSAGALLTHVGIGANYFLSDNSFSPFIGGEFGYGLARASVTHETVNGFVLMPQIGAHLFRTTDINIELALFGTYMLKKGTLGRPVVYGLRVGLYY